MMFFKTDWEGDKRGGRWHGYDKRRGEGVQEEAWLNGI